MTPSIFWYDYETTGTDPRRDRPLQVAGLRTDEALNIIGEPVNLYCRPADDILPHPAACLITGIHPRTLLDQGQDEAEFFTRLHAELARPGTCGAGYNSLRFDDEFTRYGLYRNFFDPYAREWQGGNSRWDLIDLVRAAYALRPEGIVWPQQDGRVSLRLELLTQANGIDHGQAHDALSDVTATIGLARLLRERQPRLYEYLYQLRSKHQVMERVRLLQPLVHISGRFAAERHYLAVALPLAWHPRNRNALIVCDLQADPAPLLELDAETLRERLYTRRDNLADDQLPAPLKLVHINKCPVLAPLNVLRGEDRERLGLDLELCQRRAMLLRDQATQWRDKLAALYAEETFAGNGQDDPEQQLYGGFLGERDRRLCEQVRLSEPQALAREAWSFDDPRLPELLFRYRARNLPDSLTAEERLRWQAFCRERLLDPARGAPNTLAAFEQELNAQLAGADGAKRALLLDWQAYAGELARRLGCVTPEL
ncbi:exodeoxyribonuclease I [Pseudomonas flexibilis]|uniref:Exodeoxyribonuclease I n=1 Tax=Pseudomonas flexibilis TaxID=706570 RepID=A0A1N6NB05_9PSED|nr:exodeoxyribonuclease I [Pseudomonas flexibilis]KHL70923.1 exodeoxyribonuclease I [Pseudomonas flexibilis]SIP89258.1 Exodeoxyribonuclease I subunit C [Pseudomonas flexibilis]